MPNYHFTAGPKRKRQHDEYPALRRRGVRSDTRWLSRRDRVITKALLRAVRRWDTYAARVRKYELTGQESEKTHEWRLILQNGRLIDGLRRLPRNVKERRDRLAENGHGSLFLPEVPFHAGIRPTKPTSDSFGE